MEERSKYVTVSCAEHHETLVQRLWHFYKMGQGLDFDFPTSGGRPILAHLLVVDAFMSPGTFKQPDRCHANSDSLDSLLEFMYRGTVSVPEKGLNELLEVAKEYNFKMLIDAVESTFKGREEPRPVATPKPADGTGGLFMHVEEEEREEEEIEENKDEEEEVNVDRVIAVAAKPPSRKRKLIQQPVTRRKSSSKTVMKSTPAQKPLRLKDVVACVEESSDDTDSTDDEEKSNSGQFMPDVNIKLTSVVSNPVPGQNTRSMKTRANRREQIERVPAVDVAEEPTPLPSTSEASIVAFRSLRHSCSSCSFRTYDKAMLRLHQISHDPAKAKPVFGCKSCQKLFLSRALLLSHEEKHHPAPSPPVLKCSLCSYETINRVNLNAHLFRRHDLNYNGVPIEKNLVCDFCDFRCARPCHLKDHVAVKHSTDKPFKCPLCPYATSLKEDIQIHNNRIHLNIKNYACDLCDYKCYNNHLLRRHRRIHTGERPFVCEVCGKAYAELASLRIHARGHDGNAAQCVCHICGHMVKRQQQLKAHLINVHKMDAGTASAIVSKRKKAVTTTNLESVKQQPLPMPSVAADSPLSNKT